ncbi:MAG: DEAD/DEAH box helicase [Gammaproteobacteria bacterium]|nr:DEAD/DEAH box helicase [Gammaproteobacteria bacterium]
MSFNTLGLKAELLRAIETQGYTIPTPVQSQAIPAILKGGDILAGAQTGTGKTAAFTLPMLQRLSDATTETTTKRKRAVRALVLTPTRELAAQVAESTQNYGKHLALKSTVVFGGVNIKPQIDKLRQGVDIIVATPGRLLDHATQKTVDLSKVEILILDEADRMLDMGFINDIKKILALIPDKRQNLLFSATYSSEIKQLAQQLLHEPTMIEVARQNTATETVSQLVHPVDRARKRELLTHIIDTGEWKQVLVFTRTKHSANRLSKQLEQSGITSAAIHGNKSQAQRTKALKSFKTNGIRVLVATDIAARGLDIDQLPHVVNFELPNVAEDYVHRIGRTGRAGNEGEAVSLVCIDELKLLNGIEKLIERDIKKETVEGFAPDPAIKAEVIPNGRNNNGGRQQQNRRPSSQAKPARNGTSQRKQPAQRSRNNNQPNKNRQHHSGPSTQELHQHQASDGMGLQVDPPQGTGEVNGNSIHYKPSQPKQVKRQGQNRNKNSNKGSNKKPREVASLFGG